jgi:hypothetical protein
MKTETEKKETGKYDDFLYQSHPPCPRCKKEMHIAVLSGSSDPTGHTNEYYCEWCPPELNIRVIIKVRDPERIERERKYKQWRKENPIICQKHFRYGLEAILRKMRGTN